MNCNIIMANPVVIQGGAKALALLVLAGIGCISVGTTIGDVIVRMRYGKLDGWAIVATADKYRAFNITTADGKKAHFYRFTEEEWQTLKDGANVDLVTKPTTDIDLK